MAAAALLGLAFLSKYKAVFLVAPLYLMALRAGVRFTAIPARQWLLAAGVFVAFVSPHLAGNILDSGADFSGELSFRLHTLISRVSPTDLVTRSVAELPRLTVFWADALIWGALAAGEDASPSIPGVITTIPALCYCSFSGVAYLWRGRGAVVPAACGLLILTQLFVVALLYDMFFANYMPLSAILGIGTAVTTVDGARLLASRFHWSIVRTRVVIVGLAVGALIWGIVGRGSPTHFAAMSINAAAERNLGAYLEAHPDPEVPHFVTTENLTGVPEAITGGAIRTIKAYRYLECQPRVSSAREVAAESLERDRPCVQRRFERLLEAFPGPVRFLVPVKRAAARHDFAVDRGPDGELGSSLEAAAAHVGRAVREEASFSGRGTGPVLRLVRVEATSTTRRGLRGCEQYGRYRARLRSCIHLEKNLG